MKKTLAALLLVPGLAMAQFQTGNSLLTGLRQDGAAERSAATGFVIGVHDAWSGIAVCSPAKATVGQVRDVVQQWLEANPALRSEDGAALVFVALSKTWPCPTKAKPQGGAL